MRRGQKQKVTMQTDQWQPYEASVKKHQSDNPSALRQAVFNLIREKSRLQPTPGANVNTYTLYLQAPDSRPVVLGHQPLVPNLFLTEPDATRLRAAGIPVDAEVPAVTADGKSRTSGLNVKAAFGKETAWRFKLDTVETTKKILETLNLLASDTIPPDVLARWIGRLRHFFPDFSRFSEPDADFDERERTYKLITAEKLRADIAIAQSDPDYLNAVQTACANSNLLQWRVYWPISPKGDADFTAITPAFKALVRAAADSAAHPRAVADFSAAWLQNVPKAQRDSARQIAGFILMHLSPQAGIYFRRSLLDALYLEAFGRKFPISDDPALDYQAEHEFATRVQTALDTAGLAPRDLIDVQSALWVVFNYKEEDRMATPTKMIRPATFGPLNTILYGPPGTGKTFATARHAVTICDGMAHEDNKQVQARFNELRAEGRISLVTFHQSFSYEDFVEGLRPVTSSEDDASPSKNETQGGFRLEPHKGVLRRIADLATKRPAPIGSLPISISGKNLFKMGLGNSHYSDYDYIFDECIEGGYLLLGYGGTIDWSDAKYKEKMAILNRWKKEEQDTTGHNPNVTSIQSFRNEMKVNDLVVVSNGAKGFRAIGEVTGPYAFFKRKEDEYHHRRGVKWLWSDSDGLSIDLILDCSLRPRTVYRINPKYIKKVSLAQFLAPQSVDAPRLPHVLVMDEINRANVSKVFGELITLLEEDKRAGAENEVSVKLPYSQDDFTLPANLHFLGTMNTADRSIALLDTALRRRFDFVEMAPDPALLGVVDGVDLAGLLTAMNDRIEYLVGRDHLVGHAFFMGAQTRSDIDRIMRRKVIPLLCEYFHEDWEKVIAILGDSGQGGFIERKQLPVPPGLDDLAGDPRWRYIVRAEFAADAYAALGQ